MKMWIAVVLMMVACVAQAENQGSVVAYVGSTAHYFTNCEVRGIRFNAPFKHVAINSPSIMSFDCAEHSTNIEVRPNYHIDKAFRIDEVSIKLPSGGVLLNDCRLGNLTVLDQTSYGQTFDLTLVSVDCRYRR